MRRYDGVLGVTPEMEELAKEWEIILKPIRVVEHGEARRLLKRKTVVFTPRIDAPLLSLARQSGSAVGILTKWIDENSLGYYMRVVNLVRNMGVPLLLATGAESVEEMRHPLDVAAVGMVLGLSPNQAHAGVSWLWEEYD